MTQEDILLIMDNCGSHVEGLNLPGLRVEFLLPKSTNKYQPFDLGIIANKTSIYFAARYNRQSHSMEHW